MDTEKNICPYNNGCECDTPDCERCGWFPPVAAERKKEVMSLTRYKIPFTGYCEVWAKSEEEAAAKADNGDMFFADYDFGDPINLAKEEEDEVE